MLCSVFSLFYGNGGRAFQKGKISARMGKKGKTINLTQ